MSGDTRAQTAYRRLRDDIVRGALEPGAKLRIGELQKRYGLGAIPLREALNRLSSESLVEIHQQRGFSAPPLDFDAYVDITNARLVIEGAALRLSIAQGDAAWEERLVLAIHRLAKAGPAPGADAASIDALMSEAWAAAHLDFHMELLSNSQNQWLLGLARSLYEHSARYRTRRRRLSATQAPVRLNLVQEHRDITDACIARDADAASALLVEHCRRSVEIVLGAEVALGRDPLRFVPARAPDAPRDGAADNAEMSDATPGG